MQNYTFGKKLHIQEAKISAPECEITHPECEKKTLLVGFHAGLHIQYRLCLKLVSFPKK